MSVVLGKDATAKGRTGKAALEMFPGYSLASITAGQARASEQIIYRAPAADEPDHGEVKGEKPKAVQRGFAKQAKWVVLVIPS